MTTQKIVFTAPNIVELLEEEVAPPQAHEFLVRAEVSLVSTGTELIILGGNFEPNSHWANWVRYPMHPGYNMVGTVEHVGSDAPFQVGDRVATRTSHRSLGKGDARTVKVPDDVSSDNAAWFGMANIAQNGVRRAEHRLGDAVVIIGAGLLGQLVTQYVRLQGAREIIVIDPAPARLQMAREHGATQTLDLAVQDARDAVFDWTQGRGADVVYDVTGHPAVLSAALPLARKFGTLLLLGDSAHPGEQRLTQDVITRAVRIIGAHDSNPPEAASDRDPWSHITMSELFFTYLQRGQMRVADMETHRFKPHAAPAAYAQLQHDRSTAMGVLFDWR
ncbi:MAG TPA: zinc-binding dehydrogenase [Abditibacteriaceae bacterium]|jgi:2-desacetyl-2-hydroxyethyl bacteriochlorophyllide A dehydrogenase